MKFDTIVKCQVAFLLVTLLCWTVNVYKLTTCDFKPSYKAEVMYGLGVFTPTCYITAWMEINDESEE